MLKLNYFNYCAFGVMMVVIITVLSRRMLKGRRNRYFWNLIMITLVTTVFDIVAVALDNGSGANVLEKYVTHAGYLIVHCLSAPVYVVYLACLTDRLHEWKESIWVKVFIALPYAVEFLLLISSLYHHQMFYIDSAYRYVRGPWYPVLYICSFFYIGVGVVYVLRCRKSFAKGQFVSMLFIFPILIVALGIQLAYPGIRVEMFSHALGVLFLLLMVQRPEERTDAVTGFGSSSALATDIEQALMNKKPLHIMLLNIANYKSIRDILGYESSQKLMRAAASVISEYLNTDLKRADPYYLGQGRFCLTVGKEDFKRTYEAATQLGELFKEDVMMQDMDINLIMNLCIIKCPEDMNAFQEIWAFCNEFEEYGKDGSVLYARDILQDGRYIIKDIEDIIENAVNNDRMAVYYQPIYSVADGTFHSAEALLRLDDEEYGRISPELFIPVAEKNGVIHRIGYFVLEEVCKFIASEEYKELGLEYIEVNLSVAQCMRSKLAGEILELMNKYHIRPEQINLEITETAAVNSQNIMSENIRKLREAGVPFSLDDYGTGYSNIRRVATMPFELIKLDKTFTDLEDNEKLKVVVRNTVKMIKEMNMKIVVEGIETKHLVDVFADMECDYIQGYYFSKPLSREKFVQFIRKSKIC